MSGIRTLRARAARLLAGEEGLALVMAMGIVLVLSISAAAAVEIVRANQVSATRDRLGAPALGRAEAAADAGANALIQSSGATTSGSTTVDGVSIPWSTTVSGSTYTVQATAHSADGKVSKVVQRQVLEQSTPGTPSKVYGYGFFMGDPLADCTTLTTQGNQIGNGAQVTMPVYIASSLCLSGGSNPVLGNPPSGGKLDIYIGGKLRVDGPTNAIGTSTSPVGQLTIVGGCQVKPKKSWVSVPCDKQGDPNSGTGSGAYATTYDATKQSVTKPPLGTAEADAYYSGADLGPMDATSTTCTGALAGFKFDNNTVRDTSLGTIQLLSSKGNTSASSFDCKFMSGATVIGQLTWTYGTPGSLVVKGTVFIDGNLLFTANDKAVYTAVGGSALLVVDGTVSFDSGARICGAPFSGSDCGSTWDGSSNVLEIVAVNHQNANPGWSMTGDGHFEGIAFLNGRYSGANGSWVRGPVIADSGQLTGATESKAISSPPPEAPGAAIPTTTWALGNWRQCPATAGCS